jgi:hypothetical protein
MAKWLARFIIFFIVVTGCTVAYRYACVHFKPDRQIILLNRTRPDFSQLLEFEKNSQAVFPRSEVKGYIDYFKLVVDAMPGNGDGVLMLGYLDLISAHKKQAVALLKEAYRIDPQFFFTGYDLALVLDEQGEYAKSADILKQMMAIPPGATISHMMKSTVYRQILASMKDGSDIILGLHQAYNDAYLLLMETQAHLENTESKGADLVPDVHAHIM